MFHFFLFTFPFFFDRHGLSSRSRGSRLHSPKLIFSHLVGLCRWHQKQLEVLGRGRQALAGISGVVADVALTGQRLLHSMLRPGRYDRSWTSKQKRVQFQVAGVRKVSGRRKPLRMSEQRERVPVEDGRNEGETMSMPLSAVRGKRVFEAQGEEEEEERTD